MFGPVVITVLVAGLGTTTALLVVGGHPGRRRGGLRARADGPDHVIPARPAARRGPAQPVRRADGRSLAAAHRRVRRDRGRRRRHLRRGLLWPASPWRSARSARCSPGCTSATRQLTQWSLAMRIGGGGRLRRRRRAHVRASGASRSRCSSPASASRPHWRPCRRSSPAASLLRHRGGLRLGRHRPTAWRLGGLGRGRNRDRPRGRNRRPDGQPRGGRAIGRRRDRLQARPARSRAPIAGH